MGISAMHGVNAYRGLVRVGKNAKNARNISECDSLLIGNSCKAHTYPYHEIRNSSANIEHEATTSKISDEQLFYLQQRGIDEEDAIAMIVNGFCKEADQIIERKKTKKNRTTKERKKKTKKNKKPKMKKT